MKSRVLFIVLALVSFLSGWSMGVENNEVSDSSSSCTSEAAAYCAEQNRQCRNDTCGTCLLGHVQIVEVQESRSATTAPCMDINNLSWEDFFAAFEPMYKEDADTAATTPTQAERAAVLLEAALLISKHNSDASSSSSSNVYELGLSPYSADTGEDYLHRSGYFFVNVTGTPDELPAFDAPTVATADLPVTVDWVSAGAVTSVKDQGRCGCCWAISLAGAIEGAAYIENDYFQSMSFQQFISCNNRNLGCDGGNLQIGAGYATLNSWGGLSRLNDYEFTDYKGTTTESCDLSGSTPLAVDISKPSVVAGFFVPLPFDKRIEAFRQALAKQPVAVVMKSACNLLSNYKSGILTDDGDCQVFSENDLDHAVLMVGYGVDGGSGVSFFKFKNSWGTKWGEDGYFRVADIEKNGYGLFGLFSEGVVANARNLTTEVPEEEQDVPLPIWAIVLIALGSVCCCITIIGVWRRICYHK